VYLQIQLIHCFTYKTSDGVAKYKLTYPVVVVRKFVISPSGVEGGRSLHQTALPVQSSFYHHPGFFLTFYEQSLNSDVSRRAEGQFYSTQPFSSDTDVNLSPACDVRVLVGLPSFPLMSLATVTPYFIFNC